MQSRAKRNPEVMRLLNALPQLPATELANHAGAVTRDVLRQGAAVITKHREPVMVLMSVERYAELARAGAPDLEALALQFEALYQQMQAPGVAARTIGALDLRGRDDEQSLQVSTSEQPRLPRHD